MVKIANTADDELNGKINLKIQLAPDATKSSHLHTGRSEVDIHPGRFSLNELPSLSSFMGDDPAENPPSILLTVHELGNEQGEYSSESDVKKYVSYALDDA